MFVFVMKLPLLCFKEIWFRVALKILESNNYQQPYSNKEYMYLAAS